MCKPLCFYRQGCPGCKLLVESDTAWIQECHVLFYFIRIKSIITTYVGSAIAITSLYREFGPILCFPSQISLPGPVQFSGAGTNLVPSHKSVFLFPQQCFGWEESYSLEGRRREKCLNTVQGSRMKNSGKVLQRDPNLGDRWEQKWCVSEVVSHISAVRGTWRTAECAQQFGAISAQVKTG